MTGSSSLMRESGEKIALNAHFETAPCTSAVEWMKPFLSSHSYTSDLEAELDRRSFHIYDLVGAENEEEFVFGSSHAEVLNQVMWSVFLEVVRKEGKTHFIVSALEDAATMQVMKRFEELGCTVKIAPIDAQGKIDLVKLEELISPRTALISVTIAEGSIGVVQPYAEIGEMAKKRGTLLHLDASYAVGKLSLSFSHLDADYLTFSGDKIHSVGGGALFYKKSRPIVPLILGGPGLRGGPFDVAGFMAFAAACSQSLLFLDHMGLEVARLRDRFELELMQNIPHTTILFKDELRLPNTSAVCFSRVHQEALVYFLAQDQLLASTGGERSQKIKSLLLSSGVDRDKASSAMSFSLTRMTTEEEISLAVEIIRKRVTFLRKISDGVFT